MERRPRPLWLTGVREKGHAQKLKAGLKAGLKAESKIWEVSITWNNFQEELNISKTRMGWRGSFYLGRMKIKKVENGLAGRRELE